MSEFEKRNKVSQFRLTPQFFYGKYKEGEKIPTGKKVGDKREKVAGVMYKAVIFVGGKKYYATAFEQKEPTIVSESGNKFFSLNCGLEEG